MMTFDIHFQGHMIRDFVDGRDAIIVVEIVLKLGQR